MPDLTSTQGSVSRIRVASVPAGHPYVLNLGFDGDGVERLPDPIANGEKWWPPKMLDPSWAIEHHDDFDLFHIHFGFDAEDPERLRELCETLAGLGKPIVYTVHDLENPHHADQSLHRAQMGVLMAAASEIVTLTRRARFAIWRDHGRSATVIPHPHIFPLDSLPRVRDRDPGAPLAVGLHFKSLRRNMIGPPMLDAVAAAVEGFGPERAFLRVDVHNDVWEGAGGEVARDLRKRLTAMERSGRVDLRVHDFFDDDEFREYIGGIDISVLPYAFGTHSGWMEACRDLGTAVVAPGHGCYSDQGAVFAYRVDGGVPVTGSVEAAIRDASRAIDRHTVEPLGPDFRRSQRVRISRAHRDIYRRLLGDPDGPVGAAGGRHGFRRAGPGARRTGQPAADGPASPIP